MDNDDKKEFFFEGCETYSKNEKIDPKLNNFQTNNMIGEDSLSTKKFKIFGDSIMSQNTINSNTHRKLRFFKSRKSGINLYNKNEFSNFKIETKKLSTPQAFINKTFYDPYKTNGNFQNVNNSTMKSGKKIKSKNKAKVKPILNIIKRRQIMFKKEWNMSATKEMSKYKKSFVNQPKITYLFNKTLLKWGKLRHIELISETEKYKKERNVFQLQEDYPWIFRNIKIRKIRNSKI